MTREMRKHFKQAKTKHNHQICGVTKESLAGTVYTQYSEHTTDLRQRLNQKASKKKAFAPQKMANHVPGQLNHFMVSNDVFFLQASIKNGKV